MAVFPQEMVLPAYGSGTLAEVLPSACATLGVPGADNALGLPASDRWVVLLVDGLGDVLLRESAQGAPFLAGLPGARTITSGVPSTTVTSLTCLGTGRPPGQHGMAGYLCRVPETGEVLNALVWDSRVAPRDFQPLPTWFEVARAAGVRVGSVSPARFQGSGLTYAALRGPDFHGVTDEADEDFRVAATVAAATSADRTLVYAYERELDHTGHTLGRASTAWADRLARVDALCARLRAELPDDVRLLVTGDHGMIDVPGRNFVVVEDERDLLADVDQLAGEGRLRQLHTRDPRAVAARYADRMGDHAWVRTRDEAIDEGWFGPVDDRVRGRFGDVLVAMRTDWAVMSRRLGREMQLVGMHGSLTPVEMRVPLLVA